MANLQENNSCGNKKTVTSRSKTPNANYAVNLSADSKVGENMILNGDRNVSQKVNVGEKTRKKRVIGHKQKFSSNNIDIAVPLSEYASCQDTQGNKSSSQFTNHKSCDQTDTSRISISGNVKSDDSNMQDTPAISHLQHSIVSKRKKGRPNKSPPCLPTKDNIIESLGKKSKSSSSFTKGGNPSGDCDIEFNALTLAKLMGIEKPLEKIPVKSSGNDKEEEITKHISPVEIIQQIIDYRKYCQCSCLADLNMQEIASHRLEITLLDRSSRDFFIMGLLRCGAITFKETCRHNSRIRNRFCYRLMNTRICHCCFLAVNNIGGKYLKNLKKHYAEHGVTSRSHGNLGRKPYHAISSSDITDVVEFVNRYASNHGVLSARRSKNPKSKHILRLPCSDNVTLVHKKYKEFNKHSGKRTIALTSFRKIWNHHLSHIKLTVKDTVSPVKNTQSSNDPQDSAPNANSNTDNSTLKQMLKSKRSNQNLKSVIQSSDLRTSMSQKLPVSLPYEYSDAEMPHTQMTSLNMYLNDGNNHDALQYGYIFPQNSVIMPHHLETVPSNRISPLSVYISSKTSATQVSPSSIQQPSFPVSMNSSLKHIAVTDAYNSNPDKHLLLLSPSSVVANSSQLPMSQYNHKTAVPVFTHTSLIANADPDVHQQTSSPIESGLTTLSQQINMSLFQ